jgi:hypothetical protein
MFVFFLVQAMFSKKKAPSVFSKKSEGAPKEILRSAKYFQSVEGECFSRFLIGHSSETSNGCKESL